MFIWQSIHSAQTSLGKRGHKFLNDSLYSNNENTDQHIIKALRITAKMLYGTGAFDESVALVTQIHE